MADGINSKRCSPGHATTIDVSTLLGTQLGWQGRKDRRTEGHKVFWSLAAESQDHRMGLPENEGGIDRLTEDMGVSAWVLGR